MLTSIIANMFLWSLVVCVVVTMFFIFLNARDAREESRSMFDQYKRARRFAKSTQLHNGHSNRVVHLREHRVRPDTSDVIDDTRVLVPHSAHSAK